MIPRVLSMTNLSILINQTVRPSLSVEKGGEDINIEVLGQIKKLLQKLMQIIFLSKMKKIWKTLQILRGRIRKIEKKIDRLN